MSMAVSHPAPWTVEDVYALPEDGMRHELLDGTLLVSPPPSVTHQLAAQRLVSALGAAAGPDLEVLEAVGVRISHGLLAPDIVVARAAAVHTAGRELQAADVLTVGEIVSPSSRTSDRRWKPEAYAEAGIVTFLRVELDGLDAPSVLVFTLRQGRYEQTGAAVGTSRVELLVPFSVHLRAVALRGPHA